MAKQTDPQARFRLPPGQSWLGLETSLNSPEEFAGFIKSDTAKWAK
jgi:hypothetical protein